MAWTGKPQKASNLEYYALVGLLLTICPIALIVGIAIIVSNM